MLIFDVAVIGGGVIGGMIARKLASYKLNICIIEKDSDVAMGATRANSAIVHAGFDAKEGSLKAKMNVRGSCLMENVARELGVKYKRNGSLVIGFSEEDRVALEALCQRGITNGVDGVRVVDRDELKALEPNISDNALCALYAPTGAIICPYELTIAAIGNAMDNGAKLFLNFPVESIVEEDGLYSIMSGEREVKARYVINAAGLYSEEIPKWWATPHSPFTRAVESIFSLTVSAVISQSTLSSACRQRWVRVSLSPRRLTEICFSVLQARTLMKRTISR